MDGNDLITRLRQEMHRSLVQALYYSDLWNRRNDWLTAKYSHDPGALYIAKRDDQKLNDRLAAYTWHRDNSTWAKSMIEMLQNETVSGVPKFPALKGEGRAEGIPAQRV